MATTRELGRSRPGKAALPRQMDDMSVTSSSSWAPRLPLDGLGVSRSPSTASLASLGLSVASFDPTSGLSSSSASTRAAPSPFKRGNLAALGYTGTLDAGMQSVGSFQPTGWSASGAAHASVHHSRAQHGKAGAFVERRKDFPGPQVHGSPSRGSHTAAGSGVVAEASHHLPPIIPTTVAVPGLGFVSILPADGDLNIPAPLSTADLAAAAAFPVCGSVASSAGSQRPAAAATSGKLHLERQNGTRSLVSQMKTQASRSERDGNAYSHGLDGGARTAKGAADSSTESSESDGSSSDSDKSSESDSSTSGSDSEDDSSDEEVSAGAPAPGDVPHTAASTSQLSARPTRTVSASSDSSDASSSSTSSSSSSSSSASSFSSTASTSSVDNGAAASLSASSASQRVTSLPSIPAAQVTAGPGADRRAAAAHGIKNERSEGKAAAAAHSTPAPRTDNNDDNETCAVPARLADGVGAATGTTATASTEASLVPILPCKRKRSQQASVDCSGAAAADGTALVGSAAKKPRNESTHESKPAAGVVESGCDATADGGAAEESADAAALFSKKRKRRVHARKLRRGRVEGGEPEADADADGIDAVPAVTALEASHRAAVPPPAAAAQLPAPSKAGPDVAPRQGLAPIALTKTLSLPVAPSSVAISSSCPAASLAPTPAAPAPRPIPKPGAAVVAHPAAQAVPNGRAVLPAPACAALNGGGPAPALGLLKPLAVSRRSAPAAEDAASTSRDAAAEAGLMPPPPALTAAQIEARKLNRKQRRMIQRGDGEQAEPGPTVSAGAAGGACSTAGVGVAGSSVAPSRVSTTSAPSAQVAGGLKAASAAVAHLAASSQPGKRARVDSTASAGASKGSGSKIGVAAACVSAVTASVTATDAKAVGATVHVSTAGLAAPEERQETIGAKRKRAKPAAACEAASNGTADAGAGSDLLESSVNSVLQTSAKRGTAAVTVTKAGAAGAKSTAAALKPAAKLSGPASGTPVAAVSEVSVPTAASAAAGAAAACRAAAQGGALPVVSAQSAAKPASSNTAATHSPPPPAPAAALVPSLSWGPGLEDALQDLMGGFL